LHDALAEVLTMNSLDSSATASNTTRLRDIRSRLPGQMLDERLEMARLSYGPLYSLAQIREAVAATLPRRVGFIRGALIERIEDYRAEIPDEALLKYDDALQSGIFSSFWVATPAYYSDKQTDPWILGQVVGSDLYAVIAQWDVAVPQWERVA
jgi:hypothetical protein